MPDLLVNLLKLPLQEEAQEFIIRRAQTFELSAVRSFVETNFSMSWADEISVGFARQPVSVYIATIDREIAGSRRTNARVVDSLVQRESSRLRSTKASAKLCCWLHSGA